MGGRSWAGPRRDRGRSVTRMVQPERAAHVTMDGALVADRLPDASVKQSPTQESHLHTNVSSVERRAGIMRRAVWVALVLLVFIGITAAGFRVVFVGDAAARLEPLRTWLLAEAHVSDPAQAERAERIAAFDRRFAMHSVATLLHIIPGGLFLLLLPLQFVAAIRRRHPIFHRWLGRGLVIAAVAAALPGMYFGLRMPYGGVGEAIAIAGVGGWLLAALSSAVVAIRRGDVARHRQWMIRAVAVALGISTVRLVAAPLDFLLLPYGIGPEKVLVLSLWAGWAITFASAEWWIRRTRPRESAALSEQRRAA